MKITQFAQITGNTRLLGVIGDPISHSLSPVIHNAAFHKMNLDWCYIPIPCKTTNLESVIQSLRAIDFKGLNITIPHKINAIKLCKEIDPIAKKIGSINTLIQNKNGGWNATNTDVEGFIQPLKNKNTWEGKEAIILGCGGSAKAVVAGLEILNFKKITLTGRKEKSLHDFLNKFDHEKLNLNSPTHVEGYLSTDTKLIERIKQADLIVNTTPVGMLRKEEAYESQENIPLGSEIWKNLESKTTLYDLIYNPRPTEWLKLGAKYGCRQIDGLEMLIQQGAASLRIWSGKNIIPIDSMRNAAKNHLLDYHSKKETIQ